MLCWTTSFLAKQRTRRILVFTRNPLARRLVHHAFNNNQSLREHIDFIDINSLLNVILILNGYHILHSLYVYRAAPACQTQLKKNMFTKTLFNVNHD